MNKTDFRYSAAGAVVAPVRCAKALQVKVSKYCWPVLASLKKKAGERAAYCQTPDHPGCVSGEAHEQWDEAREYFEDLFSSRRVLIAAGNQAGPAAPIRRVDAPR